MTDKTIGNLTAAGALDGTELVHVVQGGNSRRVTTAALAGVASVVLADINLSARDLRIGQSPLSITGIDDFFEIVIDHYATAATTAEFKIRLSSDGGVNWEDAAGDYTASFFNATSTTRLSTAFNAALPIAQSSATSMGLAVMGGMGNANARTFISAQCFGNASEYKAHIVRTTAQVDDAMLIFSDAAHTGGRLVVVGRR